MKQFKDKKIAEFANTKKFDSVSFDKGSEKRAAMVGGEPTTNQRENLDKFAAPNNNINQCFFGRLGVLLPRSYKYFGIEGSKVCNFNFFSFASQGSINTHSNRQYRCPFIFGKNGRTRNKSDCFEQGNMGLFVEQRYQNYCRIPPSVTQGRGI